jgi:DNA invertase Pin-like site-specific DNA recombinase
MGYFSNLHQSIIELHEDGVSLDEIAIRLKVDLGTVAEIIKDYEEDNYDDSMDGDHDSAMASAGFGTDEDYGYYGDE